MPCSFTPLIRNIVSGVLFLRTWLRNVSWRLWARSAIVVSPLPVLWKAAAETPTPRPLKCRIIQICTSRFGAHSASMLPVRTPGGSAAGDFGRPMKFRPQLERKQARGAVADRLAVDLHHRHDEVGGRRDKGLPRILGFLDAEGAFDEFDALPLQEIDQRRARDAAQNGIVDLTGHEPALAVDDPRIR